MEGLCDQETRQEKGVYLLLEYYHQHAMVYFVMKGIGVIALRVQDLCCISKGGKALQASSTKEPEHNGLG